MVYFDDPKRKLRKMFLISIITVNFNQPNATIELLKSIELHYSNASLETILVDNGSKENYENKFKAVKKDIKYIRSEENLGFAGGNNLGINAASGKYLFLVNNDTEFTAGLIETLMKTLDENPRVGMISPKINYFDDQTIIQYAGFTEMNYYTCRNRCIGQFEKDQGQYDHIVAPTGYAHGAAMMIRKDVLPKSGLMAENFFLYYEEMDWCELVKRAGYEIWVNTNALIYHKESLSVGKNSALKEYFMNRNRILFIRRNANLRQRLFFYCYFVLFVAPRNLLQYIIKKEFSFIPVFLRAIGWNLTNHINSKKLGYTLK
jgi:GT2 family glycosyltransferase